MTVIASESQGDASAAPAAPGTASSPLISVVVPVYNVQAYLVQCVESIQLQTYTNLEIVLVDDGSTDRSGDMCDELSRGDARIVAVHKENGGLSDARNYGVSVSKGDYIAFVDSDDYISPVFIEALYRALEQCGSKIAAVPGGCYFYDGDEAFLDVDLCRLIEQETVKVAELDYQRDMLYQRVTTGAPWRLYARDVVEAHPFPVGLLYEDLATTYKFVEGVKSIALVKSTALYAYRLRETSIIRQRYSRKKAESAVAASRGMFADITQWYPSLEMAAASRCFSVNRMVLAQVPAEYVEDRDSLWRELKKYRKLVLRDGDARKRERLAALVSLLGKEPFLLFCRACRASGLLR